MSWRVLILFLIMVALGAGVGGIMLGEWLVESAPSVVSRSNPSGSKDPEPVLDADGKPFAAQPPQPLVDGTLGVPKAMAETEWKIPETSLVDVQDGAFRQLDTVSGLPPGPADISTVDVTKVNGFGTPSPSATAPIQTPQASTPSNQGKPVSKPPAPRATSSDWLQSLRKEISQCESMGFFQRPTCIQTARNRYCSPNNGWGKVPECPARSFDQPGA